MSQARPSQPQHLQMLDAPLPFQGPVPQLSHQVLHLAGQVIQEPVWPHRASRGKIGWVGGWVGKGGGVVPAAVRAHTAAARIAPCHAATVSGDGKVAPPSRGTPLPLPTFQACGSIGGSGVGRVARAYVVGQQGATGGVTPHTHRAARVFGE